MSTRPSSPADDGTPNPTDRLNPFAGLGAGLDFFQDWMKAAGSAMPNLQAAAGAAPAGLPAWSLPTLDPEELDKRIRDLKTVQFWLEQNARMIAMTIQGMEVQRMTLATLKGMNVSMDAVRDALKVRPDSPASGVEAPAAPDWMARARASAASADRPADAAPVAEQAPESPAAGAEASRSAEASPELINPMRWWDTLTQQFTHLANQAAASAMPPAAPAAAQAPPQAAGSAPARDRSRTADKAPPRKTAATGSPRSPSRPAARRRGDPQAD
ncbi:PhaM family polyhydroxyalkanoate granule multifunctional regulatory protein [Aquabacterium olei]|uniref:PhaM family polyhydroxyalkanoate granule multifunctional regulatory protein n=1 Tax=Aquabacterium olei TaxID=1296669 RepID=UPI0015D00171|nr:PhaM family polyhydroxyalkanoate granule multifunctional regulatory protein [Aquabacterium olei]